MSETIIAMSAMIIAALYMLTVQRQMTYWAGGLEIALAVIVLFQAVLLPTFGMCMFFILNLGLVFDGGDRIIETWKESREKIYE